VIDTLGDTITFVESLPEGEDPELYGLHPNAAISSAHFEANFIVGSLISLGSSGLSSGSSTDKNKLIQDRANDLLSTLPKLLDVELVNTRFKIDYYESMNTVLVQEVLR